MSLPEDVVSEINDIMALLDERDVEELQDGDVTIKDVMERYKETRDKAERRLDNLVKEGLAEKVQVFDPRVKRKCYAYRVK